MAFSSTRRRPSCQRTVRATRTTSISISNGRRRRWAAPLTWSGGIPTPPAPRTSATGRPQPIVTSLGHRQQAIMPGMSARMMALITQAGVLHRRLLSAQAPKRYIFPLSSQVTWFPWMQMRIMLCRLKMFLQTQYKPHLPRAIPFGCIWYSPTSFPPTRPLPAIGKCATRPGVSFRNSLSR